MSNPRVLVAGIGNIFLGDDAFGVEVAQRLMARPLPEGVRVVDFGIRSLDLAEALLENYEAVILVDAVPRGAAPGTLYVIEPELPDATPLAPVALDPHALEPAQVLQYARANGIRVRHVLLVGCEPHPPGDDDFSPDGPSAAVRAAVEPAVEMVLTLAEKCRNRCARSFVDPQLQ